MPVHATINVRFNYQMCTFMKKIKVTALRQNIYQVLDEILASGVPVAVERQGQQLVIAPLQPVDKLARLPRRDDVILGDPEALPDIHWDEALQLDLP